MNKPDNPKCDSCRIINNALRCWQCKYKTEKWMAQHLMSIILEGDYDLYIPKDEEKE